MTTAVIVQARMGSSRFPEKVLQDLGGISVLERVLRRCSAIEGADVVVCAVPDEARSVRLEEVARKVGAVTFFGSESDVLGRYLGAARAVGADIIVRVTSDCPFIDPEIAGRVVALRERESADFASNDNPRSFPQGLDTEVLTRAVLEEAVSHASAADEREHVTLWMVRAPHLKRVNLTSHDEALAEKRWTLDYFEDLAFFRAVLAELPPGAEPRMAEVMSVLARKPEIEALNAGCSNPLTDTQVDS